MLRHRHRGGGDLVERLLAGAHGEAQEAAGRASGDVQAGLRAAVDGGDRVAEHRRAVRGSESRGILVAADVDDVGLRVAQIDVAQASAAAPARTPPERGRGRGRAPSRCARRSRRVARLTAQLRRGARGARAEGPAGAERGRSRDRALAARRVGAEVAPHREIHRRAVRVRRGGGEQQDHRGASYGRSRISILPLDGTNCASLQKPPVKGKIALCDAARHAGCNSRWQQSVGVLPRSA